MVRMLAVLVALVLAGHPAVAQQRIFAVIDAPDGLSNALWEARVDEGRVSDVRLRAITPGRGYGPATSAGGQMVLWQTFTSPAYSLAIFDRSTGTTLVVPGQQGGVLDPTRPRMFTVLDDAIVSVTVGGMSVLPGTSGLRPLRMSADGRRLYVTRVVSAGPPATYELGALDPESGLALGAIAIGPYPVSIAPAPDDLSVWVISATSDSPDQPLLRRLEWPSGEERITIPLGRSMPPTWTVWHWIVGIDSARHRVVVATSSRGWWTGTSTGLSIRDTENGTQVGTGGYAGMGPAMLDQGAGEILGISQSDYSPPRDAVLLRHSVETGQVLSRYNLGTTTDLGHTGFAPPPRAPLLEPPLVSTPRTVTLLWLRAPELTLGFTVEAGSAPGLANLGTFPVTNGTTLTVPNVPPGTYYVRVRAWNYIGPSVPSNEIVVEVR